MNNYDIIKNHMHTWLQAVRKNIKTDVKGWICEQSQHVYSLYINKI